MVVAMRTEETTLRGRQRARVRSFGVRGTCWEHIFTPSLALTVRDILEEIRVFCVLLWRMCVYAFVCWSVCARWLMSVMRVASDLLVTSRSFPVR